MSEWVPAGPDPLLMPVLPPEYYTETEARSQETLAGFLKESWAQPVSVVRGVRWGSPVEAIVAYAREQQIDLLVIATHGRTGLGHVILGSVAERIVREAPCPVLTLRSPEHPSTT
jgi:nucleotide-binding universal stress UspA family protein